jgi:hypothetical protein
MQTQINKLIKYIDSDNHIVMYDGKYIYRIAVHYPGNLIYMYTDKHNEEKYERFYVDKDKSWNYLYVYKLTEVRL